MFMDKEPVTKMQDLKTADIVVFRSGLLGMVMAEYETILFQDSGSDWFMNFNEDLTYEDEDRPEWDIMLVYRPDLGHMSDFRDYENECDIVFERPADPDGGEWLRPVLKREKVISPIDYMLPKLPEVPREELITVIVQGFYGNRTGTELKRSEVDRFILNGSTHPDLLPDRYPLDRTVVRIPYDEHLVLLYNRYMEKEDRYREVDLAKDPRWLPKPVAFFPELDLKIFSRCLVCRMDENGELQSLQCGDADKFLKYLAR